VSNPPDWLSQDLILDHFGAPDQQGKYLSFVENLIGETYETTLTTAVNPLCSALGWLRSRQL